MRAKLEPTLQEMARYIHGTTDLTRKDRLWPAHYMVFATNPLSLSLGACGTALFLQEVQGGLPAEVRTWLEAQPLDVEGYPPGLYMGLAGIAYSFLRLGMTERAEQAMALAYESPLLYAEPGMFLGAAGWGLASLEFFHRTGKAAYLERAIQAGEHLLRTATREGDTCRWRCEVEERVHYGFGFGASGIALFLAYLHRDTGRSDFLETALQGMEYDIAQKVESAVGWQWRRFEGDSLLYPYWIHGAAGVAGTLIRLHQLTGVERYASLAERIADDSYIKYSFIPCLFEGLAGIGELMLDMYRYTGKEHYLDRAHDIAESVLWFRIDRPEGTAFPGRWLTRISHDYATGAAGVGLFLHRLLQPRERLLVDLVQRRAGAHG
ncbi:lanthionine synthetase C family protein [Myxococcaceae bacterium GXIMD 01537]